jgi:hypothetical protein
MAHCDTIGGDQPNASQNTYAPQNTSSGGGFWDNLFGVNFQENALRKKIGKLLAAGDCRGAAQLAYEKGRIELGAEIAQTCRPTSAR